MGIADKYNSLICRKKKRKKEEKKKSKGSELDNLREALK